MYYILLYCIVMYCIVLYCIEMYCIVLYCIVLCCIVLCCIVLYCIVLYCIVLYCIVMYCVVTLRLLVWWFASGAKAGPRNLPFPNLIFLHSRYSLCYCHTPFLKIYIPLNIRTLLLLPYYVMLFHVVSASVGFRGPLACRLSIPFRSLCESSR